MKKFLLTLTVLTLLAGCDEAVVDQEPTVEETSQKVEAPEPFYITALTTDGRMAGGNEMSIDPVKWLAASDGTCITPSPDTEGEIEVEGVPVCNPNGFLILNETSDDVHGFMIADDVPVYVRNLSTLLGLEYGSEEGTMISFEQLVEAFEKYPDFFAVTPFELEYGTVTVEGIEMSDQVSAIKEIYIP